MESKTAALEDLMVRRDAAEAAALDAYAARTAAGQRAVQELRTANDKEYKALRRKCAERNLTREHKVLASRPGRPLGQVADHRDMEQARFETILA